LGGGGRGSSGDNDGGNDIEGKERKKVSKF
jgi:hypothetical protein